MTEEKTNRPEPVRSGDSSLLVDLSSEIGMATRIPSAADMEAVDASLRPASAAKVDPNVKVSEEGTASHSSRVEGTNEIYVKAPGFESMYAKSDETSKSSSGLGHIRMSAPGLQPTIPAPSHVVDETRSNCFGIVSSGILPCVTVDKSFESPCVDENMIEPRRMSTHSAIRMLREGTGEVFVSRLDGNASEPVPATPTHTAAVSGQGHGKSMFGLPLPNTAGQALHPEDNNDAEVPAESYRRFAIQNLYDTRLTEILRAEVDETGLDADLDRLLVHLVDICGAEHPKVIYLDSEDCHYASYRLLRAFLRRCGEAIDNFSCYTSAQSPGNSPYDLVTALVSSRVGCFPDDPEEARRESILRGSRGFFHPTDYQWGLDILLVRYDLTQFMTTQRDVSILKTRNESDLFEVLLNMVERDASRGPVVIAISEEYVRPYYAWTDIIRQIKSLHSPNILVIAAAPPEDEEELRDGDEIFRCAPLIEADVQAIYGKTFEEYQLSPQTLQNLSAHAGTTFTDIRRTASILHDEIRNYRTNPQALDAAIPQLPQNSADRAVVYYNALTDDQRHFLCVASLLGSRFYLRDMILIMSLEPLPGEVPWHCDLRTKWAEDIAASLTRIGELIPLSEDAKRGKRFLIPEWRLFCEFSDDPVAERHIRGCYAHLLEREKADPCEVAVAYENAGIWTKATRHWLEIGRHLGDAFYNRSAYTLFATCLQHIGPENDVLFVQLLTACIEQVMRMGRFDEAKSYAEVLAQYGYLMQDKSLSCRAFIQLGNALRVEGEFSRCRDLLLSTIKMAEEIQDDSLICDSYFALAELLYDAGEKGALVNALRYAEKAQEICRRDGNLSKLAENLTLCARIFVLRGEPERARKAAGEAYHALQVSGGWYHTPYPLCVLAECAFALNEPLPLDHIERGFAVADKTGDVLQQFRLLVSRVRIMVNTLQKKAVSADLEEIHKIVTRWPYKPWIAQYKLLVAMFDFSRRNFAKTTHSLKDFFETATTLGNSYLLGRGYVLSAQLNFEVYRRQLGSISLEKTEKLYLVSTNIYESLGAWHFVAETQRDYAAFLDYMHRGPEAEKARERADKVDPYCQ